LNRKERRHAAKTGGPPPGRHAAGLQAAFGYYTQGNLNAAEAVLRQILAADPNQPEAMRLFGEVLADRGRFAEALALLQRLVALQPRDAKAHAALGNALRLGGQADAAIAAYRAALARNPELAGAHHGLGAVYRQTEREAEAAEHFRQTLRLQPDWAPGWRDLGMTLAVLGELGPAQAALERAVALQPALGDAQRHLAALRQKPADGAELSAMSARAGDSRTPVAERIELGFALGRSSEKNQDYDAAFGHFSAANHLLRAELVRAGRGFDRPRLSADIDRIIATWTAQKFAAFAGQGNPSEQPVFIVGMPRSGSSLFEQIAASHARVYGAGERTGIGAIAQRLGWAPSPAWTQAAIATAAEDYLASLPKTDAARIIDKMPDNIFQLGLIATLFPNARVIFCERDPRDLAISCFFQHFSEPYAFDTDLGDIGFRIRALERLKNHWLEALPLRCLILSYETLLAAPEAESRRLIDFLGLEWDEKCLAFHQTERVVRTASWAQVRKPLYADSVGRWKHYERHLGSMQKAAAF
jgi:tetratricopeptide (TPR) repeat protein